MNKFAQLLKLNFSDDNNAWVSQTKTLRRLIGISGMLLPLLLVGCLYIYTGHKHELSSISHYYFTRVCSIFVITVGVLGVFLIIYSGKGMREFLLSTLAGMFALLMLLFPTGNISNKCGFDDTVCAVTFLPDSPGRELFHYISAAIFLLSLACLSLFIFTKTKTGKIIGWRKWARNIIHVLCGLLMLIALGVAFAGYLSEEGVVDLISVEFYNSHHLTFWMEFIAVESFGISWLVKGKTIFKDK